MLIGGRGHDILSDQASGVHTIFRYAALADAPISETEFEIIVGFMPGEDVIDFSPLAARIGRALTLAGNGAFTGAWQVACAAWTRRCRIGWSRI